MPNESVDWRSSVRFGSNVSTSQRAALSLFFDRVSNHAFGRDFLRRISQNGALTINTSNTARSSYDPDTRVIDLANLTFNNEGDGNYIITMLHELTHHAYRRHYVFALHNTVESFARSLRDQARLQGFSEAQYKEIIAPLARILNYEQAASINAAFLANQIFAYDVDAGNYYILPYSDRGNPDPDFDYTTPELGVTTAEVEEFRETTSRVERYSLATPMDTVNEATFIFNRVIDRAVAAGLYSEKRGVQLKEFYLQRSRVRIDFYAARNRLRGFDMGSAPDIRIVDKVDSDGVPYGWDVYELSDGDSKLLESYEVLYERNEDGSLVLDSNGAAIKLGIKSIQDGLGVQRLVSPGTDTVIDTDIFIPGNPLGVEFSDLGAALGQQLGYRLAGNNAILGVGASSLLQTLGDNVGDVFDGLLFTANGETNGLSEVASVAFESFPDELLANVKSAGIGALSSFLTAELMDALALDGFAGELANTSAGAVIGQVLANVSAGNPVFGGVNPALVGNAIGSFLGAKLAQEVLSFDTIGGQIGSSVGSSLGGVAVAGLFAEKLAFLGGFAGPLGALAGAFVGFLVGGLIGSVFAGTPRSGADVSWNAENGRYETTGVYSRKGGSKEAAIALTDTVASTLNSILEISGSFLSDPETVTTGNYGMRKSDFVYRERSTQDKSAIVFRIDSEADGAFEKIMNHGLFRALADKDFELIGGDLMVKRAIYASIDLSSISTFESSAVLGNIATAKAYGAILQNQLLVGGVLHSDSSSAFAAETAIVLTRSVELGLNKRHRSDWFGGYSSLLEASELTAGEVTFGLDYDANSGNYARYMALDDYYIGDTVNVVEQTYLESGEADDIISFRHSKENSAGLEVYGGAAVLENFEGVLVSGAPAVEGMVVDVAAVINSGDGHDTVHASDLGDTVFGGAGNDRLYGGKLDDWLLGGDGDDYLEAGGQSGGLGGDGNYLDGGAGDDTIIGREGSDWLEGGDGIDTLRGDDGGDILSGGAGIGDKLYGGGGDDTYLFRRGDGHDTVDDVDARAPTAPAVSNPQDYPNVDLSDPIAARFAALASGALRQDWTGKSASVSQGKVAGGEDAIAFGQGIGIGDVRLARVTGTNDLSIEIIAINDAGVEEASGDRLTIKDWFTDPFKRVEWLKFVDGTEIRIADVTSFIVGSSDDDVLIGTNGNDFIFGDAGDDEIYSLAGDDVANGGTGNDMVAGDDGRDLLLGGLGDDQLMGGRGRDAISGDAGADDIYGGADNDVISGGRGDGDVLVGGTGDDTFKFSRGDGHDTVFDDYADYWQVVWSSAGGWNTAGGYTQTSTTEVTGPDGEYVYKNVGTESEPQLEWVGRFDFDATTGVLKRFVPPAGAATITRDSGVDTIEFALNIDIQDIVLHNPLGTNDLVLLVGEENANSSVVSDSITLKDWYVTPGGVEKLAFYSTGILDIDPTKRRLIAGTEGHDGSLSTPLSGTALRDWITGGGGDDVIAGGDGEDILAGNSGFDMLRGEAGNDVLYGGAGNDILDGGMGRDILIGGAGFDAASYASSAGGVEVHLSAPHANTGEAIGDEFHSIEDLIGSAGADELGGDEGENELTGGRGNDMLAGNVGDDGYIWNIGDGADVIAEGAFSVEEAVTAEGALAEGYSVSRWQPTGEIDPASGWRYWQLQVEGPDGFLVYDSAGYLYPSTTSPTEPLPTSYIQSGWLDGYVRTSGQQTTRLEYDTSIDGGNDVLEFGKGISLDSLAFAWEGDDLVIRHLGESTSSITLRGQASANTAVEDILLSDGFAFSLASVVFAESDQQASGTEDGDVVVGRYGVFADNLAGGAGDDVLAGYAGADMLSGGAGNDVIEGGLGADIIDGGTDDGGAGDTVRYAGSATGVTVDLTLSGAQGGNASSDAYGDQISNVESIVGSSHADTLTGDANDNRLFGLGGNDILRGGDGANVLDGGDGDDHINGGDGEDNIEGGEGKDVIYALGGADLVSGGAGDDKIYGGGGNDELLGGSGNDHLEGNWGNDRLQGGDGGDVLVGGAGNDTLAGGAGNDWLQGDAGDDNYLFDRNSGSDTIADNEGVNTLVFDDTVSHDQIWMTRVGSDLLVSVIGGDTAVTITGYFAQSTERPVRSINTTSHAIFIDHPETLALIDAMTVIGAVPDAMPSQIAELLPTYWHEGGKAAPVAPETARGAQLGEDGSLTLDGNYGVIDHDANIVSYAILEGSEPQLGSISALDPATGALTYTPFADTYGEDEFTLIATDADGHAVEVPVHIVIDAVNDAPRALAVGGNGLLTVAEKAPGSGTTVGTLIGRFTAEDIEGDEIQYSLVNDPAGRFSLLPNGELRVGDAVLFDREAAGSHTVQIAATDAHGAVVTANFTVTVTNVNEAPDKPVSTSSMGTRGEYVVSTNTSNLGRSVVTFSLSDPDGGPSPALRFTSGAAGNPGGMFKIVGNRVEFASEPDFEALVAQGMAITDSDGDGFNEVVLTGSVEAFDGQLASAQSASFTVRIEDVNQRHTAIALAGKAATIAERDRTAAGVSKPALVLGTLNVSDPDLGNQLSGQHAFAVFENGSATASTRFAVDSANRLVLLSNQSLDYETDGATITLTVRATDKSSAPFSIEQDYTFSIVNKDDILEGTAAANTLTGQQNRDIIYGYAGHDVLNGLAGADELHGGDGNDHLLGGTGNDLLLGGAWSDRLEGEGGHDTLYGGYGSDTLDGGDGDDLLYGEEGDDGTRATGSEWYRGFTAVGLSGGSGNDILDGGDGDDYLDGGQGADHLAGGAGFDGVTYESSSAPVTVNLATGTGSGGDAQGDVLSGIELVAGSNGSDTLIGSSGNDVLLGGSGWDTIYGGAGNDYLHGGNGNDTLDAQSGNDLLEGGAGDDLLIGGSGNDTYFVGRHQGNDTIRNYDSTDTDFDHLAFDGSVLYSDIWFEQDGDDLRLILLGDTGIDGTVTVENWFAANSGDDFKIELISDGTDRATITVDVDELARIMGDIPSGSRPTTRAQMESLRNTDPSFRNGMEEHWGRLSAPKISDTGTISGIEALDNGETKVTFALRAWFEDEQGLGVVIPASLIDLSLSTSGGQTLTDYIKNVSFGTPDANGNRTVTLTLADNASTHTLPGGILPLQLKAQIRGTTRTTFDPGGIALSIAPTADTGSFTNLTSAGGNAGSNIPILVNAQSPDAGEVVDVLVKGLPAGYSLVNSAGTAIGTYESASGWWRLTTAQLTGLRMKVPSGRFEDASLSFAVQTRDGPSVRTTGWTPLSIAVNGAPTGLSLNGTGTDSAASVNEFVSGSYSPNGAIVGIVVPTDPDRLDSSLISPNVADLPGRGHGEERLVSTTGPTGGSVQVLETGQGATMSAGGGVPWASAGAADTTKAYKFTIYFKPGNDLDHSLYFGTSGNVQNASTGTANTNPYFWSGRSDGLVQDRWYRIEGYVLPEGHSLVADGVFGGVYDTVTGDKVADTRTFRFGAGGSETGARFFSFYGSEEGYSAQWYQPVVEMVEHEFSLDNDAGGRFSIDPVTGLVTANGTAFNHEGSPSHTITVRITDANGLVKTQNVTIGVNDLNEQNTLPASYGWNVNENVAIGTLVGTVAASDPDAANEAFGQQRYYFKTGTTVSNISADNRYRIDAVTGKIYTYSGLNFEAGNTSVAYTVIARDNAGAAGYSQDQTTVTIGINNLNEQNTLPASYSWNVNENVAVGTQVGEVTASDPDAASVAFGQQRYFFLNGSSVSSVSADNRYRIDAVSGKIYTYSSLNFEAGNTSAAYTVIARDNAGGAGFKQDQTTVTIGINNLNEQNALAAISNRQVMENKAAGTVVATASASDPDAATDQFGKQRYFFLNGGTASSVSADGLFAINATSGAITTRSVFDYDTMAIRSAAYTVIARDNAGAAGFTQSQRSFTISIGNVNEMHTLTAASGAVLENQTTPPGTPPGPSFNLRNSMLEDPEGHGMSWTFADGSTQSGIWSINSNGIVYLTAGGVDYETVTTRYEERWVYPDPPLGGGGYPYDPYEPYIPDDPYQEPYLTYVAVRDHSLATQTLSVKATDADGNSVIGTFTATVTDVNEGPNLSSSRTFYVSDDQSTGYIGQVRGTDPETGAAAASFRIISVSKLEKGLSPGSSADVDNTGYPYVSIAATGTSAGKLYFSLPGDGEWEGGIKYHPTLGGRWYFQLNYVMQIGLKDASGVEKVEEVTVIFKKHGTSSVLPILLDLDGDGLELVDYDSSAVHFDMDLDGVADRTGWVGADDALLALDRNGNGTIDDSSEISFADDLENALTDLEGLRAFDTNANGLLDAGDERFAEFVVWQDINQNGVSDEGELRSLAEAGIVQLNLTLNQTGEEPADDHNVIFATTDYLKDDGSLGVVGDVSFAFEPSNTEDNTAEGLPDDVELVWVAPDDSGQAAYQTEPGAGEDQEPANSEDTAEDDQYGLAAPIVLDFDGDGEGLVSLSQSTTSFDQDGDGELERTGWIENGDALLALDRNENGTIDDIGEISFLNDKEGAKTDLEGLAAFDSNGDGVLDARDDRFVEFKLWFDRDSDGVTDAGELQSLAQAGVTSINLTGTATGETVTPGSNIVYNRTEFVRDDNSVGTVMDSGFAYLVNETTHQTGLTGEASATEFSPKTLALDSKSKKYRIFSMGGEIAVVLRKANGPQDPRAGATGPVSEMQFSDRTYGYLDAIVFDLDRDGVETKRYSKTDTRFDMNGDGVADDTGWTTSGDGFLVVDRNDNGTIDNGSELSFYLDAPEARSALQGLAAFDSNEDGLVSILDERFGELKIWVDQDHDGNSDEGEVRSLSDQGIVSISLRSWTSQESEKVGRNLLLSTGVFNFADGSTGTFADMALSFRPASGPAIASQPRDPQWRDYWQRDQVPQMEELSLNDVLRDDFFRRFEGPLAEAGELLPAEEQAAPLMHSEKVAGLHNEAADRLAELGFNREDIVSAASNRARLLAMVMQDMAAFGPSGGLEDQLRNRHQPYAHIDIYS